MTQNSVAHVIFWRVNDAKRVIPSIPTQERIAAQKEADKGGSKQLVTDLKRAEQAARGVKRAERKASAAGTKFMKGGDPNKVMMALTEFAMACSARHRALFGHAGPEGCSTADGIMANLFSDNLIGGRTLSSAEKAQKAPGAADPRNGEKTDISKAQISQAGIAMAVRNYAVMWSSYFKDLGPATMRIG